MAKVSKNTSVALGGHFNDFIREQVASGRFGSASEVIREGLRILEERETRFATLRAALEEGEQSGFASNFSLERLLSKVKRSAKK